MPERAHCCEMMAGQVNHRCEQHRDPFDCEDHLVYYSERLGAYGLIIHDGGESLILIRHCPWCGAALPEPPEE